jgi:hypothetical protein
MVERGAGAKPRRGMTGGAPLFLERSRAEWVGKRREPEEAVRKPNGRQTKTSARKGAEPYRRNQCEQTKFC